MSDTTTRTQIEYITAPLLRDAIALFLEHRQHAGLSADTVRLYTRQLTTWRRWRSTHGYSTLLADITIDDLRAYMTYLQSEHLPHQENTHRPHQDAQLAPATVASIWRTIRALWNFLIDEQLLSDTQATFFLRKRIPAPKVPTQIRKTYDNATFKALLTAAAEQQRGPVRPVRDRAILLLLYDTGMRVAELCSLCDDDMNYAERQAVVMGKGDKQRYVFWTERTTAALLAYTAVRSGGAGGPLFRGYGSRNSGGKLTADGVRGIIDRLARKAGIDLVDGAPVHALRHTFAHRFLDNGGDGLTLQQLLGHSSISTTQRYCLENPSGLRRAYRKAFDE
jgi:site-specific recombinase XerD